MVAVLEAVARLKDEFSGPVDKIAGKTRQTEGALAGLGKTVAGTAAGFVAAQASIAGVQKVFDASIGSAMRFDAQMAEIRALTGATAKDTDFLKGSIIDLAKTLPKSAAELGAGAYFVLSSGFTNAADAANILKIAAEASTIGLGDTQVVADALTGVLKAYSMGAGEAEHVTDILMQAVKDGKAEADSFAGVLGRVTPLAAQMGVSFEEVAANMASFTRLGVSAEEAATGLRGVLTQLIKPSDEARDLLASVGLTFQDVRQQIREKGLLGAVNDLLGAFRGNEEAIGILFPDVRGLTNVLATMGPAAAGTVEILNNMGTVAKGNTRRGLEEVSDTAEYKTKMAMNRLNTELMLAGEQALPLVAEGAGVAGDAITVFAAAVRLAQGDLSGFDSDLGDVGLKLLRLGDKVTGVTDMADAFRLFVTGNPVEALNKIADSTGLIGDAASGAVGGVKSLFGATGEAKGMASEFKGEIADLKARTAAWKDDMVQEVEPAYTSALAAIAKEAKDARDALDGMFKTTTLEEIGAEQALNALELEAAQLEGRTDTLSGAEKARLTELQDKLIPAQRNVIDQLRLQKEGVELAAQAQTNAFPTMDEWANKAQLQADKVNLMRIALGELPSTINITVALGLAQTAELDIIRQWLAAGGVGSIVPMAEGGIVTRPTLGLVAEAGPEAVIPLTGLQATVPAASGTVFDMQELADILDSRFAWLAGSLTVELDGREVGRVIMAHAGRQADLFRRGG